MSMRLPWKWVVASVVVFATSAANAAEPGLTTVDTREVPVVPAAETPPAVVAPASTHVFEAFRYHAENARTQRMAAGLGSMIVGAAIVGAGFYVEREWDEEFAYVLWITGGVSIVGGGLSLVFKTEVERMANAHGVTKTSAPTPEQEADLERDWEKAALKAKGARQVGGAMALGFAAISFGSAAYVVAADPFEEETEHWLIPTLLVSGAGSVAAGVVAFMIETPTEAAYGQYKASRTAKPPASELTNWRVGATPLPNGGFVSLSTVF